MVKVFEYDGDVTGKLGLHTGYNDLHIGDIVNVKDSAGYDNNLAVIFDLDNNRFSVLGFLAYTLEELHEKFIVERVASYKILSDNNIAELSSFEGLKIVEKELPKLTINDIKEKLGFDFELVN